MVYLKDLTQKMDHTLKVVHEKLFHWYLVKLFFVIYAVVSFTGEINFSNPFIHFLVSLTGILIANLLFAKPYVLDKQGNEVPLTDNHQPKKTESKLLRLHKAMYQAHDFKFLLVMIFLSNYLWQTDFIHEPILNGLIKVVIYILAFMFFFKPRKQAKES